MNNTNKLELLQKIETKLCSEFGSSASQHTRMMILPKLSKTDLQAFLDMISGN